MSRRTITHRGKWSNFSCEFSQQLPSERQNRGNLCSSRRAYGHSCRIVLVFAVQAMPAAFYRHRSRGASRQIRQLMKQDSSRIARTITRSTMNGRGHAVTSMRFFCDRSHAVAEGLSTLFIMSELTRTRTAGGEENHVSRFRFLPGLHDRVM